MAKAPTAVAAKLDRVEKVGPVDAAIGMFATASVSFGDIRTLFEAIQKESSRGGLAQRLACLGQSICEEREMEFSGYQDSFEAHSARLESAVGQTAEASMDNDFQPDAVIPWQVIDADGTDFGVFASFDEAHDFANGLDTQAEYISLVRVAPEEGVSHV